MQSRTVLGINPAEAMFFRHQMGDELVFTREALSGDTTWTAVEMAEEAARALVSGLDVTG